MVVYLAGIEQKECDGVSQQGCIPYAFYSYFYMRKKEAVAERMVNNRPFHKIIFVDSGAHSFFTENHDLNISATGVKKKSTLKETPKEYFEKYIIWLKKYYDFYDYFAELDIGELVGQELVMTWRERLKEAGLFNKCVTVFHPNVMTDEDFTLMLNNSESKYIALEGDRSGRDRLAYNKYILEAYDMGIKVHGFAMTKADAFLLYGFYSVDSASWKSGTMYGTLSTFSKTAIKTVECKSYKDVIKIKGVDLDLLNHETYKINSQYKYKLAAEAYVKMSEFLTKVWEKRGVLWSKL